MASASGASASGTVRYGPRCLIATGVPKSNELQDKKRVGRAPLVRRNERRSKETTVEWPFSSLIEGLRLRTIADCPRSAAPEVRPRSAAERRHDCRRCTPGGARYIPFGFGASPR